MLNERLALGRNGSHVVKAGDGEVTFTRNRVVGVIVPITDIVIASYTNTADRGSSLVGETIKAGIALYGDFTGGLELTSGVAVCYYQ